MTFSIKGRFVDLSLLPEDTGKPDVIPESLGLRRRWSQREETKQKPSKKKRALSESEPVTVSIHSL